MSRIEQFGAALAERWQQAKAAWCSDEAKEYESRFYIALDGDAQAFDAAAAEFAVSICDLERKLAQLEQETTVLTGGRG